MAKKNTVMIIVALVSVVMIMFWVEISYQEVIKDGTVDDFQVRIGNTNYVYTSFTYTKKGKNIAHLGDYYIKDIPEDSSHTFLLIENFLDQECLVKSDYIIPSGGNVSCAYVDGKRTTDSQILDILSAVLETDFEDGDLIYISNQKDKELLLKHIVVGYEGCPVGTDYSIYAIGSVNEKWGVILRSELGTWENNKISAIFHELDSASAEILMQSKLWN